MIPALHASCNLALSPIRRDSQPIVNRILLFRILRNLQLELNALLLISFSKILFSSNILSLLVEEDKENR